MAKTKTKLAEPALFQEPEGQAPKPVAKATTKVAKGTAVAKVERLPQTPELMIVIIARAAADPNVQPEKMRALLDMQREIEADQAKKAFTADFIAMSKLLPVINATGRIEIAAKRQGGKAQSTPYATFNEIHRVVTPILRDHGFALSYATEPMGGGERLLVKTILDHVGGHQRSSSFPLPAESSGSKNNAQAWGSAFAYGKRYGTIGLLNIVSFAKADQDDDGRSARSLEAGSHEEVVDETPATITGAQAKELLKAINDCGVGPATFLQKYQIDAVHELASELFAEAMKSCADYGKRKQAAR